MKKPALFQNIQDPGLRAVLSAFSPNVERGALSALAAKLQRSVSAVSQWKRIPLELCGRVEALTGVPRHVQRPDIFIPPEMSRKKRRAS